MSMRSTAFVVVSALLTVVRAASAHDTFIMPDAFRVSPGQTSASPARLSYWATLTFEIP